MNVYSEKHSGTGSVARYYRKLGNRIDRIRHRFEQQLLARYARGDVFDCTIGVGRFIGELPGAASYSGLDISQDFVDHVARSHPAVPVRQGDLTAGIPEESNKFDCVICLRSLSAIGHLDVILPEMVRIARPGGTIIADYGRKPVTLTLSGVPFVIDGEDFSGEVSRLDASVVERVRCDGLLTRLKKSGVVFRFLEHGLGAYLPEAALLAGETLARPLLWEREIVVLRKLGSAS